MLHKLEFVCKVRVRQVIELLQLEYVRDANNNNQNLNTYYTIASTSSDFISLHFVTFKLVSIICIL